MRVKTLAKRASVILAAIGLALFILVRHSATEGRFECSRTVRGEPMRVHLKVVQYRPWVGLWSDSAGAVWMEAPDFVTTYYPMVRVFADQVQFRTGDDLLRAQSGTLSLLSGNMQAGLPGQGWVDFTCTPSDKL